MSKHVIAVLTIGGSDPSGGAGIQEDLKVFSTLDVHGCSVVTCITAQNTRTVSSIHPLPPKEVEKQLNAVVSDIELKVVKTGMLYSSDIVKVVTKALKKLECPVVVDPVLVASVGRKLHTEDYVDAFKKRILPFSYVITPNVDEASKLSGIDILTMGDMKKAARIITKMGASNVLIKGYQSGPEVVDLLYDGKSYARFRGIKYDKIVHGSGCAFASAITANLGKGLKLKEAVRNSRDFAARGYMFSYEIGKGLPVFNSQYRIDRYAILKELEEGVEELKGMLKPSMIPEVGINFGYALPSASSVGDVCAIKGRLSREGKKLRYGTIDFGASKHLATIILTVMRFDPEARCSVNLKYDKKAVAHATKIGMKVESFKREEEPIGRSTMEWGVESVVRGKPKVPDVIYDLGSVGKEPMIRVLGRNPENVLKKVKLITRVIK